PPDRGRDVRDAASIHGVSRRRSVAGLREGGAAAGHARMAAARHASERTAADAAHERGHQVARIHDLDGRHGRLAHGRVDRGLRGHARLGRESAAALRGDRSLATQGDAARTTRERAHQTGVVTAAHCARPGILTPNAGASVSTYVVAGVTGRVGSVVAAELLARDQRVRGLTRDAARGAAWAVGGGDAAVGSLDDPTFLARTLEGAAGFFVLLPEDPFAADFHGGRRAMADAIVSAVREREVPHVVVLSAVAASLADGNGPAKDLHYLERAVRKTAARVTVIGASWFQENVGAVVPAARAAGI